MADQTFKSTGTGGASGTSQGSGARGFDRPGGSMSPGSGSSNTMPSGAASASTTKGLGDQTKSVTDQAKSVADQAMSAGRDLKDKALGAAGSSADALKGQASQLMDTAKDMASNMASQTTDKLKQTVEGQKNVGAEYIGNLADTLRRAAREFDNDVPIAGSYMRKAASQVDNVSDSIRNGNLEDLMQEVQSFARRQPTAFLGISVLVGFAMVRFLKSSAEGAANSGSSDFADNSYGRSSGGSSGRSTGGGMTGGTSYRPQAENRGYRDEFSK
ncbi:MAG TPA: YtxH domain-containing protein [Bradyrhizobium sp.]|nr:YtxH domain-containing protein [Bradyrhizobium sp.]